MPLTVGSVFAGVGGFDLGFERAGFRVRWQIERDEAASRVLRHRFPGVRLWRDVMLFSGRAASRRRQGHVLEPVDVVCGGFPCQDVSVAGKRVGLAGSRTGLFWNLMRIVRLVEPRWVVLENVPGLLSSHGGRDLSTVLEALRERGVLDGAYRVLDSRFFGVAQRRRRVFVVGHRGGCGGRAAAVLFESGGCGGDSPTRSEARADIAATLRGRAHGAGVNAPGRGGEDDVNLLAYTLRANERNTSQGPANYLAFNPQSGGDVRLGVGEKPTALSANQTPAIFGVHANQRGELRTSERAGCLTANRSATQFDGIAISSSGERARALTASMHKRHDEDTDTLLIASLTASMGHRGHGSDRQDYLPQPMGVRRLTPLECERLQGFPAGWTCLCGEGHRGSRFCACPDSPRYRQMGNAVTVPVAEWIARRILDAEGVS